MEEDELAADATAAGAAAAPHQTLYALQALCALLFPTFDDSLFLQAAPDAEATAEASACASPIAEKAEKGIAAEKVAAQAAAAAAVQLQQHREMQQQEFLQSRGLEVVLGSARKAASACSSDLKLRRQLSELLVMLLHNLVDCAHSWSHQAAGAGSLAEGMSGAESGAGAAAVTAAAGDSGVVAMTGLQQQGDDGGSSAGCGTNNDVQQPSSSAAPAGHAGAAVEQSAQQQQQQQPPGSPGMEDAMSSPQASNGQQQQQRQQSKQQQKQQRQRGGDLPPLPPSAAAASQGSGGFPTAGNAAAAAAHSFAAVFGYQALKLMADTLLQVAVDASQLYGAASSTSSGSSTSSSSSDNADDVSDEEALEKDVMVVKDALQLLLRLLEQQPALVQALLLDVDQSPLISVVLVNPHHAALRRMAAELLERLVSSDAHPRLLQWLLLQLAAARPVAQGLPGSSEEFYELLAAMVARMGKAWGALPQQLYSVTAQMLEDEVLALRAAAAAPAPSADVIDGCSSAAAACMLLQGRLQLVLALVRTLDQRGVGADSQGGLIRLLLQDFLFPEAVQQLAAAAGRLDLPSCAAKIEPRCASASCRKAALELLAELMGDSPSSLEEGVGLLIDLHYQQQTLRSWNMQARMLRPAGQYMGLKNGGATCYMNAVFQQLFMQPAIRAGVLGAAAVEPGEASDSVFAQLQVR
jgi:hypothetical protein